MEKKMILLLLLFLMAGATFAQVPPDSSKLEQSPEPRARLIFNKPPNWPNLKGKVPRLSQQELLYRTPRGSEAIGREEVTPFYSNMPMAKFQGGKQPLPTATPDPNTRYHLLKKRFKVLPVPAEPVESVEGHQ